MFARPARLLAVLLALASATAVYAAIVGPVRRAAAADTPLLVINEIHADPADGLAGDANGDGLRSAQHDEFLEWVNAGPAPLDLSGWTLADGTAVRFTFPPGTVLASYQALVVFGGGTPKGDFHGALVLALTAGRLDLDNYFDTVTLAAPDGRTVAFTYDASLAEDQSLTRSPDLDGDWTPHLDAAATRYSPGATADGRPFSALVPNAAPEVTAVLPPPGSSAVPPTTTLHVTFSEAVDVRPDWIALTCSASGAHVLQHSATPAAAITVQPVEALAYGETCQATIRAAYISDLGQPPLALAADYTWTFNTLAPPDEAPYLAATEPDSGASGVPLTATLTLTFSEPVQAPTAAFSLDCPPQANLDLAVSGGPEVFRVVPQTALAHGRACTLTVHAEHITDLDEADPPDHPREDAFLHFRTKPVSFMLINEIDAANIGVERAEFIELFDGGIGHTALDGLSLVLYEGDRDRVYAAFDLAGYQTDAAGYFLAATRGFAPAAVDLPLIDSFLYNGRAAVALYAAPTARFPVGVGLDTRDVIDAVVYSADKTDPVSLLPLLLPGQPAVDEDERSLAAYHSSQRCPNGSGGLRQTGTFAAAAPTPRRPNTCVRDSAPEIVLAEPADGAQDVATDAIPAVTFSEPVSLYGTWARLDCSRSGTRLYSGSLTGTRIALPHDSLFAHGETCTVTLDPAQISDLDANDPPDHPAPFNWRFKVTPADFMLINEFDADTPGVDTAEFIELYDGGLGQTALDGLLLVLYNGADNRSYRAVELAGHSTDALGYFVVGGTAVSGAHLALPPGGLQNGPDAIALYVAAAGGFPNGTPVTTTGLIDAVLYSDGSTAEGLQVLLHGGEAPVDEDGRGYGEIHSSQRCPDGAGGQRRTGRYLPNNPTPGRANNCVIDEAPSVTAVQPAPGSTDVPLNAALSVQFSEPVALATDAVTLRCATSGAHRLFAAGGPTAYTLTPNAALAFGETCEARISAAKVSDLDGADPPDAPVADYAWSFTTVARPVATHIIVNEVDADTPGLDTAEFIELYDGGRGQTALDGLILVFYNGAADESYRTIDLAGLQTGPAGYFTLGGPMVVGAGMLLPAGALQNGPDAVALYAADKAGFPAGTVVTTTNLLDALAYNTNGEVDAELQVLLQPDQPQINENGRGYGEAHSSQRCPNGAGGQRRTASYLPNNPTPGGANECRIDEAPQVLAVSPTAGATAVPLDTSLSAQFSEAVEVAAGAFVLSCTKSGAHELHVERRGLVYIIDPTEALQYGETCRAKVRAASIADSDDLDPPDGLTADFSWEFATAVRPVAEHILISEVDADTPGLDRAEFVELYDGGAGHTALDGLVLAFYNGAGDTIYRLVPLDGLATDGSGYALIGGPEIAGAAVTLPAGAIQNGPDAVALYAAAPGALRIGLPLIFPGLRDAVAYTTDGEVDAGLMPLLLPGGAAANEGALRPAINDANQRCPADLATARRGTFVQNPPTPGRANNCVPDARPSVQTVAPADGSSGADPSAFLEVTFSEEVSVKGGWLAVSCGGEGEQNLAIEGGPLVFRARPARGWWPDWSGCMAVIKHKYVTDMDGFPDPLAEDFSWTFSSGAFAFAECGAPAASIDDLPALLGANATGRLSPVTIEAVVTGAFQGEEALGGFFLQEEPGASAGPQAPTGLFVPDSPQAPGARVGETVRLQGTAVLLNGMLRLEAPAAGVICPAAGAVPPLPVRLPFAPDQTLAGLLVTFDRPLVVIGNDELGRHGRLLLAPAWQPYPTALLLPGPQAAALFAEQERERLLLDDGRQLPYAVPPPPYLSAEGTVRAGSVVTQLTGVLSPTVEGRLALHPVQPVGLDHQQRPDNPPPPAPGEIRVALIDGLGYADAGGNLLPQEAGRLREKLLATMRAADAAIVIVTGLGGDQHARRALVEGLNVSDLAVRRYEAIDAPAAVEAAAPLVIYRADRLLVAGEPRLLELPSFAESTLPGLYRFQTAVTRQEISLLVLALANREACPASGADTDQGDGQACGSARRAAQAQEVAGWVAEAFPPGSDEALLVLGDLQAYAREDPLRLLQEGPLQHLNALYLAPEAYDFIANGRAGSTAHALATSPLAARVAQVLQWHHNAAEPSALDYRLVNPPSFYQAGPYRTAVHDTLLVDLGTGVPRPAFAANAPQPVGRAVQFNNATPGLRALQFFWDFGDGSPLDTSVNPQHVYTAVGSYEVTLRATTLWGASAASGMVVRVEPARQLIPFATAAP